MWTLAAVRSPGICIGLFIVAAQIYEFFSSYFLVHMQFSKGTYNYQPTDRLSLDWSNGRAAVTWESN